MSDFPAPEVPAAAQPALRRSLSLWQVVLYGLGSTVGAGIYLLIGEVARVTGTAAPAAFALASLLAGVTALSFAELVSRYPQSAGEAAYVREGFGRRDVAVVVGLLVATAGCVSAAVMTRGFVGYLAQFVAPPEALCMALFVLLLVGFSIWGVGASVTVAGAFTIVEVAGLVVVLAVAGDRLAALPDRWMELFAVADVGSWPGVALAALLAFYAFLGFEDMVNVAEEVKDVRRVLPLGIVITLVLTVVLYLALAAVCVLTVAPADLAASGAPLALVYERATGREPSAIATIGILATVNGALIQFIMAPRVLYGLASRNQLPAVLARVHPRTQTPHVATATVGAVVLALALAIPLAPLAELTSLVTLLVFASVNIALWRIKGGVDSLRPVFVVPRWVPFVGACTTIGLLLYRLSDAVWS